MKPERKGASPGGGNGGGGGKNKDALPATSGRG
jgi:hypothetical protein